MPCRYDPVPGEPGTGLYYRRLLDEMTRYLCAMCQRAPEVIEDVDGLATWWEEHQRRDAERRREEAAEHERQRKAQEARAKLTDEEAALLGVAQTRR